jgi:hypothetical protein
VQVLNTRLELAVDRDIRTALSEIERGLRSEGLQPVRAIFSVKTPEVPIVLSVLGTTFAAGGGLLKLLQWLPSPARASRVSRGDC